MIPPEFLTDLARLYIQDASREQQAFDIEVSDNPYDGDYLPLNLWDQTPDE